MKKEIKKQEPQKKKQNKLVIVLAMLLLFIPVIAAYPLGLPMMNLWDAFVENVFGSFWISIFALCIVMFVILMLGGISAWTNLTYQAIFVMAMAIGYGQAIITIPLWVALMSWSTFQILQYINLSSR